MGIVGWTFVLLRILSIDPRFVDDWLSLEFPCDNVVTSNFLEAFGGSPVLIGGGDEMLRMSGTFEVVAFATSGMFAEFGTVVTVGPATAFGIVDGTFDWAGDVFGYAGMEGVEGVVTS